MTIETKYDIGDKVWIMLFDEPEIATIESIKFFTTSNRQYIDYYVVPNDCSGGCFFEECSLFTTKEELIKSL